jgi:hypothetical protein
MFALYWALRQCLPYAFDRGKADAAGGAVTLGMAHLGCFWRFEVWMYMLVLQQATCW